MKRKKAAPKAPSQKSSAPDPMMQPVLVKDVFATFLDVARSIGNEVQARRAFDSEVGVYVTEKGLVDDFNAWREARAAKPAVER